MPIQHTCTYIFEYAESHRFIIKHEAHMRYIEDIQVFGVNTSFISLSEVKNFYIS